MARIRRVPTFPTTVQIVRGTNPVTGTTVYTGPAEKVLNAKQQAILISAPPLTLYVLPVAIYFPAGTDVRGALQTGGLDFVLWESRTDWVYLVKAVDDVAHGFANKFRVAFCWPFALPTPLP